MNKNILIAAALFLAACGGGGGGNGGQPAAGGWQRHAANPLILPQPDATTIDYSTADPSVLLDPSDNKWKIWFSSSLKNRTTLVETMTIKYAESTDGVNWTTPVIAFQTSGNANDWDYTHAETPMVLINPDPVAPASQRFLLWYSGGNTTLAASQNRPTGFPYYQIGLAYSADGKSFTRVTPGLNNQPGLTLAADAALFGNLPGAYGDGLVADPDVIYKNNSFHIWFSSYAETVPNPVAPTGRTPLAFGISHAVSSDGVNWTFPHDNPLPSLRKPGETASGQQPSVLFNPARNQYEMWFTNDTANESKTVPCNAFQATGFWHAVSGDGVNWTPEYSAQHFTWQPGNAYESLGLMTGVKVVLINGEYRAYYSSWSSVQIPDPINYKCPDQQGGLLSAVTSLNLATYTAP